MAESLFRGDIDSKHCMLLEPFQIYTDLCREVAWLVRYEAWAMANCWNPDNEDVVEWQDKAHQEAMFDEEDDEINLNNDGGNNVEDDLIARIDENENGNFFQYQDQGKSSQKKNVQEYAKFTDKDGRKKYAVYCADCNLFTVVSFEPKAGRDVFCKTCLKKKQRIEICGKCGRVTSVPVNLKKEMYLCRECMMDAKKCL